MESKKQVSSTSSFTADLFGTTESSTSSTGIFDSILPRPATILGMKSSSSDVIGSRKKQASGNQGWNNKQGTAVANSYRSSIFQEERAEPCHLSSSIYYGGQDNYSQYPTAQTAGSYPILNNDGGEGDPNANSQGASRGNWWQGSLYY